MEVGYCLSGVSGIFIWLSRFGVEANSDAAIEFEEMLLTRRPEEIFAAEDETDWNEWVEFFSRTREIDDRREKMGTKKWV
ncbi:hypothetical protein [Candidatus Thiosymbion oneisti]|uniref:hypothetical protein n=1 Tax=Candidatus Thiosymbion oneisti TaxID=589554 RepID=UPI000B7D286C|nr:hypothetical protein [Candidatus Thiosymbion oneisti]